MAARSRSSFQAPISRILVLPGRRPLDEGHVANLMVSFQEVGQRQAIELRPLADSDPRRADYGWTLTAGRHRLEAAKRLGRRAIDAVSEDEPELDARIAEVDENLIRRDYTVLERAQALASRLDAWAAKYPERTVQDDAGAKPKRGRPEKLRHGAAISTMGFSEEAAERSGLSKRTVERDLALYRGLPAGLQEKLIATPIADNPGLLRQIAALGDRKEQGKVVELLLQGRTRNVSDARAIAAGKAPSKPAQTPVDEAVKAFRALWGKASPSAKAAILHDLAGRKLPAGYTITEASDV